MTGHARDSLNAAMTETDRLARMIEGLLAMARMEESAVTPEPVGLDQVCAERLHTWTPFFERHRAHLALLGDPVGHALAVPGAMEQILDNLLSNALRATPLGSTVTTVLRCTAPDRRRLPARPAWIQLHVIDEGPGMTADQRRRAFDRFWRAPDAPKGGTGLGLSLVQRLAHASGGEAALARAPGGGLDAVIRLRPAPRASHGRPAQGRPSRIGLPRRVRSDRSTPEAAPPSARSPVQGPGHQPVQGSGGAGTRRPSGPQVSWYASPPSSSAAVPAVASASQPRKASTSASGRPSSMVTASA